MILKQATFKTYSRQQIPLLPATYEDKIAAEHPVRIVDAVIDSIDLKELYKTYKGGGTSSHNPFLLLYMSVAQPVTAFKLYQNFLRLH